MFPGVGRGANRGNGLSFFLIILDDLPLVILCKFAELYFYTLEPSYYKCITSPLLQGRGLKLDSAGNPHTIGFAPLAGAWIETCRGSEYTVSNWSPLLQGRGLKQN